MTNRQLNPQEYYYKQNLKRRNQSGTFLRINCWLENSIIRELCCMYQESVSTNGMTEVNNKRGKSVVNPLPII